MLWVRRALCGCHMQATLSTGPSGRTARDKCVRCHFAAVTWMKTKTRDGSQSFELIKHAKRPSTDRALFPSDDIAVFQPGHLRSVNPSQPKIYLSFFRTSHNEKRKPNGNHVFEKRNGKIVPTNCLHQPGSEFVPAQRPHHSAKRPQDQTSNQTPGRRADGRP